MISFANYLTVACGVLAFIALTTVPILSLPLIVAGFAVNAWAEDMRWEEIRKRD